MLAMIAVRGLTLSRSLYPPCTITARVPGGGVTADPSIDDLRIVPCRPQQGFEVGRKCLLRSNPEACRVAIAQRNDATGLGIRRTSEQERTQEKQAGEYAR